MDAEQIAKIVAEMRDPSFDDSNRLAWANDIESAARGGGEAVAAAGMAKAVIRFFGARGGFDGWWGDIDAETQAEIIDALQQVFDYEFARLAPELWCLHLSGPDDVHAAPSKAHAERAAELFNTTFPQNPDVPIRASAAPWPHSPESHAESVGAFCGQWFPPAPAIPEVLAQFDADALRDAAEHLRESAQEVRALAWNGERNQPLALVLSALADLLSAAPSPEVAR